jgi:glycosyltransferase involved in cell wall biosynthesis
MSSEHNRGVIIIAPPWPRSGSANIFGAQIMAYASANYKVLLHLGPTSLWHVATQASFWDDAIAAMHFPGVENVTYSRASDLQTRFSRSFMQWLWAGRDDAIKISARYAASAALPDDLIDFIRRHPVELIQANHAFEMLLAERVSDKVVAIQGRRPLLVCETHDIQAENFFSCQPANIHSRKTDRFSSLLASELDLYRGGDILTHCSPSELEFFAAKLPGKRHELLLPTLLPSVEKQLIARRNASPEFLYDFIYCGNNNEANVASVIWLLTEVFPLVKEKSYRIAIIGRIGELVRMRNPAVFHANEGYFVGEAQDITEYYCRAHAVLAPALSGTGSSIKLIEAMCAGKAVVATSRTLRGLPQELTSAPSLAGFDAPADFATAMGAALESAEAGLINAALYDRFFSSARFRHRLNAIVGEASGELEVAGRVAFECGRRP